VSKETKNANSDTHAAADGGQQIVQALDTIARAVLGDELQSLRRSITEQDAGLVERIASARKELGETVSNLKNEVHRASAESRLKLAESEENQQKALLDLGDRTDKWIEEVKKNVQDAALSADERIAAAKSSMSDSLATQAKTLEERIDAVSRTLATVQHEMRQQYENSQRFAAVLNNLGAVFHATPPGAVDAGAPPTGVPRSMRDSAGPDQAAAGKGGANQADLDEALEQAFSRNSKS